MQEPGRLKLKLTESEISSLPEGADVTEVIFDSETIARRVAEMAVEIAEAYPEGDLLLLGLLKGSFIFMADLVRNIPRPHQVDFMVASSYGSGTKSSGNVRLLYDPETDIGDRHVLLVEDIVDSGNTLNNLIHLLHAREPKSLEIATLLHKRIASKLDKEPSFVGFDAPNKFLVGYGLDLAEDYRHLPHVVALKE
jgi:hypoxanthine phosphoribosyltransferase